MDATHLAMGANQSMFKVGPNTIVQVPLSNGKANVVTGTFIVLGQLHKITVDFFALAQRRTAGFTKLVMSFVPEPGTLLLLGAGALGLVLMGSRKR